MQNLVLINLLAFVGSLAFLGCGEEDSELPRGAVAEVRGQIITRTALDHAMVGRRAISRSAKNAPPYWPNDVAGCIRTLSERPSNHDVRRADIERRCKEQRTRERAAALRLLIQGEWYELEARKRGIDDSVPRTALVEASRHSGVEPEDIASLAKAFSLRLQLVAEALRDRPTFSRAEIGRYFEAHRDRYITGPDRFVDALVVPTRKAARQVAAALRRGRHSSQLVKQFEPEGAIDPFEGGSLNTVTQGRVTLDRAALPLGRGDVSMIKDPRGWYVFRVLSVLPKTQPTLDTARSRVLQDLEAQHARRTYEAYNKRLRSRYHQETVCADGFDIPECG